MLFAWWKLRLYCRCPGPSKDDRKARREAKWHKRQLDEIEKQIEKYKRKLEEIKSLRSSLGLDHGVTSNVLRYPNVVDQSLGAWTSSWKLNIFPSQGAATWWRSHTEDPSLTYDAPDWSARRTSGLGPRYVLSLIHI